MEINIKSSRTVVATDSAVLKIKELAEKEDATDSFLRIQISISDYSNIPRALL